MIKTLRQLQIEKVSKMTEAEYILFYQNITEEEYNIGMGMDNIKVHHELSGKCYCCGNDFSLKQFYGIKIDGLQSVELITTCRKCKFIQKQIKKIEDQILDLEWKLFNLKQK